MSTRNGERFLYLQRGSQHQLNAAPADQKALAIYELRSERNSFPNFGKLARISIQNMPVKAALLPVTR